MIEHGNTKHGGARRSGRAPEYVGWHKMLLRCRAPDNPDYKNYGGRGIKVCDRWQDFGAFIADMGPRPSPAHTIERVDNNRGYEPSNCIWATRTVQNNNRRPRTPQDHCSRDHDLSGTNLYMRPDGKRGCRACRKMNMRDYYARRRSA